jgi:hypothetical protein
MFHLSITNNTTFYVVDTNIILSFRADFLKWFHIICNQVMVLLTIDYNKMIYLWIHNMFYFYSVFYQYWLIGCLFV